jgi:erythromycin esterase
MNDRGLKGNNEWTQVSIKMNVSKDARNINFGGLFPGEGTAWFDDLELYVEGKKFYRRG